MLRDMFLTLPGWLMFFLGVFLSGWVMSLTRGLRAKTAGTSG